MWEDVLREFIPDHGNKVDQLVNLEFINNLLQKAVSGVFTMKDLYLLQKYTRYPKKNVDGDFIYFFVSIYKYFFTFRS